MFGNLRMGLMGTPMNQTYAGPSSGGFDILGKDGSMDVLGSLKKHGDFSTQFMRNAGSGPVGGGMGGLMGGFGGF